MISKSTTPPGLYLAPDTIYHVPKGRTILRTQIKCYGVPAAEKKTAFQAPLTHVSYYISFCMPRSIAYQAHCPLPFCFFASLCPQLSDGELVPYHPDEPIDVYLEFPPGFDLFERGFSFWPHSWLKAFDVVGSVRSVSATPPFPRCLEQMSPYWTYKHGAWTARFHYMLEDVKNGVWEKDVHESIYSTYIEPYLP